MASLKTASSTLSRLSGWSCVYRLMHAIDLWCVVEWVEVVGEEIVDTHTLSLSLSLSLFSLSFWGGVWQNHCVCTFEDYSMCTVVLCLVLPSICLSTHMYCPWHVQCILLPTVTFLGPVPSLCPLVLCSFIEGGRDNNIAFVACLLLCPLFKELMVVVASEQHVTTEVYLVRISTHVSVDVYIMYA